MNTDQEQCRTIKSNYILQEQNFVTAMGDKSQDPKTTNGLSHRAGAQCLRRGKDTCPNIHKRTQREGEISSFE